VVRDPIRAIEYKSQFVGQQETGIWEVSSGEGSIFRAMLAGKKGRSADTAPTS